MNAYTIGDDDLLSIVDNDCTDDRITELDVLDPLTAWVRCEAGGCETTDAAEFMIRAWDGAWLCGACDAENRAGYDDFVAAARGW